MDCRNDEDLVFLIFSRRIMGPVIASPFARFWRGWCCGVVLGFLIVRISRSFGRIFWLEILIPLEEWKPVVLI